MSRIDLLTSTFGKALGGSVRRIYNRTARSDCLAQATISPVSISNTLAPVIAATTIEALALLDSDAALRTRLMLNAADFRQKIARAGFTIKDGIHPIVPVMIGDATLAKQMSLALLDEGIYVIAFSYPVVPKDEARIRVQLSTLHTQDDIDSAVAAFRRVGQRLALVC